MSRPASVGLAGDVAARARTHAIDRSAPLQHIYRQRTYRDGSDALVAGFAAMVERGVTRTVLHTYPGLPVRATPANAAVRGNVHRLKASPVMPCEGPLRNKPPKGSRDQGIKGPTGRATAPLGACGRTPPARRPRRRVGAVLANRPGALQRINSARGLSALRCTIVHGSPVALGRLRRRTRLARAPTLDPAGQPSKAAGTKGKRRLCEQAKRPDSTIERPEPLQQWSTHHVHRHTAAMIVLAAIVTVLGLASISIGIVALTQQRSLVPRVRIHPGRWARYGWAAIIEGLALLLIGIPRAAALSDTITSYSQFIGLCIMAAMFLVSNSAKAPRR